jgi:hypothetical protein
MGRDPRQQGCAARAPATFRRPVTKQWTNILFNNGDYSGAGKCGMQYPGWLGYGASLRQMVKKAGYSGEVPQ